MLDLLDLGRRVQRLRLDRALTLQAVADAASVSVSMLSSVERGHKAPTIVVLARIADGLGVPLTDLVAPLDEQRVIVRRAAATAKVNVVPAAALTKGLRGEEITEFGLLKEAGAACLTDGRRSIQSAGLMRAAMSYAANFDLPIVHHVADAGELAAPGGTPECMTRALKRCG